MSVLHLNISLVFQTVLIRMSSNIEYTHGLRGEKRKNIENRQQHHITSLEEISNRQVFRLRAKRQLHVTSFGLNHLSFLLTRLPGHYDQWLRQFQYLLCVFTVNS